MLCRLGKVRQQEQASVLVLDFEANECSGLASGLGEDLNERLLPDQGTQPAQVGDGDESKAWRDGLTLFQLLTGIPTAGQVARSTAYVVDIKEGDTPAPQNAWDATIGFIGGTPLKK